MALGLCLVESVFSLRPSNIVSAARRMKQEKLEEIRSSLSKALLELEGWEDAKEVRRARRKLRHVLAYLPHHARVPRTS